MPTLFYLRKRHLENPNIHNIPYVRSRDQKRWKGHAKKVVSKQETTERLVKEKWWHFLRQHQSELFTILQHEKVASREQRQKQEKWPQMSGLSLSPPTIWWSRLSSKAGVHTRWNNQTTRQKNDILERTRFTRIACTIADATTIFFNVRKQFFIRG